MLSKMSKATTFKVDKNFQTPPEVCQYMASLIPDQCKTVLEPTPGLGNIVNVLKERNKYQITAAEDFFLIDETSRFDCVIMNPPFTHKSAFLDNAPDDPKLAGMKLGYYILKKCMKMSDHIIALMPWFTISDSDIRLKYLIEFGLKSLTPLPRKTFQYARIQTVVIELQKGYKGEINFNTPFHAREKVFKALENSPVCPRCLDTGFFTYGGSFGGPTMTERCFCKRKIDK